jgi:hypothetical protein
MTSRESERKAAVGVVAKLAGLVATTAMNGQI